MIINLPKNLEKETTHRYSANSFKLHRLPVPRPGQVTMKAVVLVQGAATSFCLELDSWTVKSHVTAVLCSCISAHLHQLHWQHALFSSVYCAQPHISCQWNLPFFMHVEPSVVLQTDCPGSHFLVDLSAVLYPDRPVCRYLDLWEPMELASLQL